MLTRRPAVDAALPAQELGIESTNAPRNRGWRSPDVLAALDAFAERAGRRSSRAKVRT